MKKKFALIITVILAITLFSGTIAFASGGSETQGAQDRSQYMDQIREQAKVCLENRAQIATLKSQLVDLRAQSKAHLKEMKNNTDSVTDEQLEAAKSITAQIKDVRAQLRATNASMREYKQSLKTARRSRDYEGIIAAYGDVIRVQEQRITLLQQLTELHEQIIAL